MAERRVLSVEELCRHADAVLLHGDPRARLTGAASPADAGPGELAYLAPGRDPETLRGTGAGAVIVPAPGTDLGLPSSTAVLVAEDPEITFIACLGLLYPPYEPPHGAHERACVDPGASIGEGTSVAAGAVIEAGAVIGRRCRIGAGCSIGRDVTLGDDCVLHPNVTLYQDTILRDHVVLHAGVVIGADGYGYKFRDGVHVKFPQVGRVVIESEVEIGPNCCIDRAALGFTVIGAGTKIDNLVHVAHNCRIGRGALLVGQTGLAGSCTIGDYAVVAAQSGISDHVHVGAGAKVLARTGVTRDVPAGGEVFGFPARARAKAWEEQAALRRLAGLYKPLRRLAVLLPLIEKRLAGGGNSG